MEKEKSTQLIKTFQKHHLQANTINMNITAQIRKES